jgi:ATP-binding cassette subfamily B protein
MTIETDDFGLDAVRPRSAWRTVTRLLKYALTFRVQLVLALLLLAVAVGTELAGPFVAKRMIDEHISGIERPWFRTQSEDEYSVLFEGALYKRGDRFAPDEPRGEEARLLQIGTDYYWIPGPIAFDGARSVTEDGRILIRSGEETAAYEARKVSIAEMFPFFRPEIGGLIRLCWFYFGLLAVSALFSYVQRYLLQVSANRIIRNIRTDVFGQLNRLPVRYFDRMAAGRIVSRVTNDTETIRDLYVTVLANFFTGSVYMTGIFIALFILDARMAAICLFVLPVIALWIYGYGKGAKRFNRSIRSTVGEINGVINESIQGMSVIQAFRGERKIESEFEAVNEKLFNLRQKLLNLNSLTGYNLVGVIRNIAFVAVIWYFGGASMSGPEAVVTLGVLYAFADYLNRLFNPVVNIVNQLPNLETALVSAERVFALLDEQGEDVSDRKIERFKGNVKFDNVWFAYKEGEYVLKGVSFEAKQGQTVAIVGHTGSGKSSILNLLFRFYDPERGTISIDGTDIASIPRQTLREHMGIVLQDPFLFTGTIASNISLDDPSISREQIEKALRDVGGERVFRHLEKGIDEPVIEKGSTLSAGQRQLISFARALAFDPAILILDEATSNIDTETESLIQEALEVVKKGRTTFIIAHRLSTIKNADLILVLDRAEIVERGNHDALMRKKGKYYQMYQIQQGELTAASSGA